MAVAAFTFGPAVGAGLSEFSLTTPMYVGAGVAFFNFLFAMFIIPETNPKVLVRYRVAKAKEHADGRKGIEGAAAATQRGASKWPSGNITTVVSTNCDVGSIIMPFLESLVTKSHGGNSHKNWNNSEFSSLYFKLLFEMCCQCAIFTSEAATYSSTFQQHAHAKETIVFPIDSNCQNSAELIHAVRMYCKSKLRVPEHIYPETKSQRLY